MCVIMMVGEETNTRPTEYMLNKAYDQNPDKAGIAWRQDGEVHWKKNLTRQEVLDMCKGDNLPLPYVVHFRRASIGGVRPSLTQPFQIGETASNALSGKTMGRVLFHNGTWNEWAREAREAARFSGLKIPGGKWNDSRAMAWLCHIYGIGYMEFLPEQKGVAFGPKDYEIYSGPGWRKVQGIWCSNDHFWSEPYKAPAQEIKPMCRFGQCTRTDIDADGYCGRHYKGGKVDDIRKATNEVQPRIGLTVPSTGQKQETGGSPTNVVPFPMVAPGQIIELEVAEKLAKASPRVISKQLLKSIRRYHNKIAKGGSRGEQARRNLEAISQTITSETGSIH